MDRTKTFVLLLILGCTCFSLVVKAEEDSVVAICDAIHKAQKESADYVPNVDVHGNSVAPADLNTNASNFFNDPIVIPIEIDLVQRFGLGVPADIDLKPTVTSLKIYQDGRVRYNDEEDISDRLLEICADHQKSENNTAQEHRHKATDPVVSSDDKNDKIEGQYPPRYNQ